MVVEKNTKDCFFLLRTYETTPNLYDRNHFQTTEFSGMKFIFFRFDCRPLYYCGCDVAFGLLTTGGGAGVS